MRVLLIDDDDFVVQALSRAVSSASVELVVVTNRASAVELIEFDRNFDLIICDLKLPEKEGNLALSEDHGLDAHEAWFAALPGVPQILFTGFATTWNVRDPLSRGRVSDIVGDGSSVNMVRLLHKDEMLECAQYVRELADRYLRLEESVSLDATFPLAAEEVRALKVYARRVEAVSVEATPMGGLSGARTMCAVFRDSNGSVRARTFIKINRREIVSEEHDRYRTFVPNLLLDGYPPEARVIIDGLRSAGAAFFSLASSSYKSLFSELLSDPSKAMIAIDRLRVKLSPWNESRASTECVVGDLRRIRISDEKFDDRGEFEWMEAMSTTLIEVVQHGDLHGENILVDSDGWPLVIDYGDINRAPAGLDPITLELSLVFHSDSPFRQSSWPSAEAIQSWSDLDVYLADCPFPLFVRKLREWAREGASDLQLAVVLYVHAARQLKYGDTDHARARSFMRAAASELRDMHPVQKPPGNDAQLDEDPLGPTGPVRL